jgi:hypothetical protein
MKKILTVTAVMAIAVLSIAPVSWAGDVQGTLKSVDASGRVLTLEDGTRLMIPSTVQVERKGLQPGAQVKASYEERSGEKVITAIEIGPAEAK